MSDSQPATHNVIKTKTPPPLADYAKREHRVMSAMSELIAVTGLTFLTGWFYILPLIVLSLSWWAIAHGSTKASALLMVFLSSAFWPTGGYWGAFCRSRYFVILHDYFSYHKYVTSDFETNKNYLWVEAPHGVVPMGTILLGTLFDESRDEYERLAKGSPRGIAASVVFRLPWMRHLYSWLGATPATKRSFKKTVERVGSCSVIPGGIAEMFMLDDDNERIFLRKRFGFVKVALEAGASLVPIYHFGASRVLSVSRSSFLQSMSRSLKMSLILFYGRSYLPIPRRYTSQPVIAHLPSALTLCAVHSRYAQCTHAMLSALTSLLSLRSILLQLPPAH
jgi:hypothetical protein